jgi:DNA-binding phage protein
MMLSLALVLARDDVTSQERAKAIVNAIVEQAQAIWGEDWLANLVRQYCELERAEGVDPAKATPVNRRSQILSALVEKEGKEGQNPKLETLLKLSEAVGGEIQLVFTRKEVKRF